MRAIVLLCLLGSAVAEDRGFTWRGAGKNVGISGNANICLTDQASCGCCMVQQQIHRMESFFNTTFDQLEKGITETYALLNSIKEARAAFSVALASEESCFGPFRDEKVITYQHVFINLGAGYNVDTGVFTAPRSGVYSLALTVYSDAGSPGNSLAACASLQANGQVVAGPREKNMQDQEDSATIVVALHLKAGDKVTVSLPIGCFLCDNSSHYNTFTGFLLYATD